MSFDTSVNNFFKPQSFVGNEQIKSKTQSTSETTPKMEFVAKSDAEDEKALTSSLDAQANYAIAGLSLNKSEKFGEYTELVMKYNTPQQIARIEQDQKNNPVNVMF